MKNTRLPIMDVAAEKLESGCGDVEMWGCGSEMGRELSGATGRKADVELSLNVVFTANSE